MKCAIYRRVSTDMQAEKGSSLEAQKERLHAFAISQGWEVTNDYVDDGYSAKNMDRPALQRMLSHMRQGVFDVILVYKLDRLCRSVRDLNDLIKDFEDHKVKFKSSTESLDTTTATGRMMINIVGTLAQWEREQTAERVSMILNERSKKGLWNGGPMPYGYILEDKNVTVVKEEEKIVQLCFAKAITHGSQAIAKMLNGKGYRTREGNLWYMRSILRMLHNPLYKGYVTYEENGEKHLAKVNIPDFKPIVSEETFEKVQYIIKKRTVTPTRLKSESIFTLSGILVCPKCGGKMSGTTISSKGRRYKYYRCSKLVHGVCDQKLINVSIIDAMVPKMIATMQENLPATQPNLRTDKTSVEKQLATLTGKRERAKELYIDGDLTKDQYTDRIAILNEQEKSLLSSLDNINQMISTDDISFIIESVKGYWDRWNDETKAEIIRGLLKEVYIEETYDRKFNIVDHKFI